MSPKFYSFLWVIYFVAATALWLAGAFTMLTTVVFGFVAFGFVFIGMMCVLPGAVSHPHTESNPSRNNLHTHDSVKATRAVTTFRSA